MRLLMVPQGSLCTPSSRVRVYNLAPLLKEKGWDVHIIPSPFVENAFLKKPVLLLRYLYLLSQARWADIVFLQKWVLPVPLFDRLYKTNPNIVFDFDDAIYLDRYTSEPADAGFLKRLHHILTRSAAVVAGNRTLAAYAKGYNAKVYIVPSGVDTVEFTPDKHKNNTSVVTIGWVGSKNTLPDFLLIENVLVRIQKTFGASIRVLVVSSAPPHCKHGLKVDFRPWRLVPETSNFDDIDIGVMPQQDNGWARGKCSYKALQYMALGIPTVVTPVGMNEEILEHGISGMFAVRDDEWYEALSFLISQPLERQKIGARGRMQVTKHYSLDRSAEALNRALLALIKP